MDFTREPIIETVITPKEGCKLVVRSSKSNGQEEHFVDALEVVSFGHSFFFRSLERPKTFLVPATDYEILEVREARMVLKNVGIDRAIKIGGGREGQMRTPKEPASEKANQSVEENATGEEEGGTAQSTDKSQEGRGDKKRDRRRNYRKRRGREGAAEEEGQEAGEGSSPKIELEEPHKGIEGEPSPLAQQVITTSILTSLLPPPPTLISETIGRYKENVLFKDAFYSKEEKKPSEITQETPVIPQPEYGTFELSEEEEEEIYRQRQLQSGRSEEENSEQKQEEANHAQEGENFENGEFKKEAEPQNGQL